MPVYCGLYAIMLASYLSFAVCVFVFLCSSFVSVSSVLLKKTDSVFFGSFRVIMDSGFYLACFLFQRANKRESLPEQYNTRLVTFSFRFFPHHKQTGIAFRPGVGFWIKGAGALGAVPSAT